MLLGLAADIHGNLAALDAALRDMESAGVEELLVAGDLTGYYYQTAEVLERLEQWKVCAVHGNHETELKRWLAGDGRERYHQRYGSSLRVAEDELTAEQLGYLDGLPDVISISRGDASISMTHATPTSETDYVYPDADRDALRSFSESPASLWVVGHTHHPVAWRTDHGLIVNPGSIGQQRCRRPGAHWATFDTESGALVFRVSEYDPTGLIAECAQRDPHVPYLQRVLRR